MTDQPEFPGRSSAPDNLSGAVTDMNKRQRADEERERLLRELEESRRLFQRIAETSPEAIYLFDFDTRKIEYVTARSEQVIGYTPEEVMALGERFATSLWHPDDVPSLPEHRRKLSGLADNEVYESEHRLLQPDGAYRWLHTRTAVFARGDDGRVRQILSAAQNITERKQAEEMRAQLAAIVDSSDDAIFSRSLDGIVLNWNRGAERLYGYSADEIIGRSVSILIPPEQPNELEKILERVKQGKVIQRYETSRVRKDGARIQVSLTISPIRDATGRIVSIASIAHDITERKQAEDALRESQRKYKNLVETSHDLIWSVDANSQITFLNRAAKKIYGYEPEELIGRSFFEVMDPEHHHQDLNRYKEEIAQTEEFREVETRVRHRDGRQFILSANSVVVRDEFGNPVSVTGSSRDITARKQAERVLQETKSKLELILDTSPLPITGIDPEGRITSWNKAAEQVFGWTTGEVLGQVCRTIPPEEMADYLDLIRKVMQGEAFVGLVRYRRKKSGALLTCSISLAPQRDEHGEPTGVTAIVEDITEHKGAEEAIRKSEQVLREAESLGHTGSWEQNLVTGEIFNTEENLRLFFGDDRSSGLDFEDYAQVVHPDDREYVMQRRVQLLTERGPSDMEYRVVWPDGGVHVIFGRATVVYDELGQALRVYGTNVDITERKQAEEEIHQYAARLEALAKISQAIAEVGLDVQAVFETIVRHTAELIGDTCGIRLLSSDEQWLHSVTFHNPNPEVKALMRLLHPTTATSANNSWLSPVLRTGQPLLIPIITQDQLRRSVQPEYLPFFEQVGLHSILIVPLRVKDRVIGTLGLSRDQPGHPYTPDDQVLLQDLADRASLTIQNARLFEQVQAAQERLQALSHRLLEVQESERKRLAREIHDDISQSLTALMMQLGTARNLLPSSANAARSILVQTEDLTEKTIEHTRLMIAGLRPAILDDLGLVPALRRLGHELHENTGARVRMKMARLPKRLPLQLEVALFRITQEALSNIRRHAQARHVTVELTKVPEWVILSVQDDGVGLEKPTPGSNESNDVVFAVDQVIPAGHFGLIGMQERVKLLDGKFQVMSTADRGTTIRVELPF